MDRIKEILRYTFWVAIVAAVLDKDVFWRVAMEEISHEAIECLLILTIFCIISKRFQDNKDKIPALSFWIVSIALYHLR